MIDMARATGGRVHICHVSHPMVAQVVKDAIHEGLPITAETCPHYLGFTEDFVFEKGAPAKCTPPMRRKEDMERLWDYVLDGTLSWAATTRRLRMRKRTMPQRISGMHGAVSTPSSSSCL